MFPKKGKIGGAFNYPYCHKYPSLVLLNHNNTIKDLTTLAHEMGHAIHSELSQKYQNSLNFHYSMALAEVASTFMEDFALEEVLKQSNEEEQLTLLINKIDDDIATIHRQVACYLFEKDLHQNFRKKAYLDHQEIGKLFQKHMSAYMGP
ncbi:MAG: M3 family oligoendopeptidase [bacterium]|nr:M3 family oligoendopeptidase [bacterium]